MNDKPATRRIFEHMRLLPHMEEIGAIYDELAEKMLAKVPPSLERTAALEALWDAKDAAIRACVAKPVRPSPMHDWDEFAQRWTEKSGQFGPAIAHKTTAA